MDILKFWPVLAVVALLLLNIRAAQGDKESSGALWIIGAVVAVVVVAGLATASELASIGVNVFGGVP